MAIVAMSTTLLFSSCGNGEDKKAEEPKTDTAAKVQETPTPPPAPEPFDVAVIIHKVANYGKWKAAFDMHDSARQASGLQKFVLGRGIPDTNRIVIALKMSDLEKAKAFSTSKDLEATMKKAGVISKPSVSFIHIIWFDAAANGPVRLGVSHKVKDFDAWKKAFDSHKQTRIDAGLMDRSVAYSLTDNHIVTVVFSVTDLEKAKAFMNSEDLKKKMAEAGVEGPPTINFYTVAE